MPLDLPTLLVVSLCVTSLLGLFFLRLWISDRSIEALSWWAMAYLIGGFAIGLWVIEPLVSWRVPHDVANALLFLSCGMIWSGARRFHGRHPLPLWLVMGATTWLVVVSSFDLSAAAARIVLSSLIIAAYTFLTALELKRERRNPRKAGIRAIVLSLVHGTFFLLPIIAIHLFPEALNTEGRWFALFSVLTLVYVVGMAFIAVIMTQKRSIQILKTAAATDPLTGLFNRRGFFEAAQTLIARQAATQQPVSVLMFDLDHFKKINDTFGHAIGDDALRVFAQTAAHNMRADDIVGRLGGEEFAAILPGGLDQATLVAERVRTAFEAAGQEISGQALRATVSIGALCARTAQVPVAILLEGADAALYRAKTQGRNRVACDIMAPPETAAPALAPETEGAEVADAPHCARAAA